MDARQATMPASLVEPFLQALDAQLATICSTRGSGPEVKSDARASGGDDGAWATEYVRNSCQVPEARANNRGLRGSRRHRPGGDAWSSTMPA